MLAILTLVAGGAAHELLHADEPGGPVAEASATTITAAATPHAPGKTKPAHPIPAHGCSGHCAAHAADQAPLLTLAAAPMEGPAAWRIGASVALGDLPVSGPERPPRV